MSTMPIPRSPAALGLGYAAFWVVLAVRPLNREDWLLENLLVFAAVPALALTYRRFTFSTLSYALMTAFLALHAVGAHYTYAEVPLGHWVKDAWGLSRNHYDRVIHFGFGLLMGFPVREIIVRPARMPSRWSAPLAFCALVAMSGIYEILEWLVARIVHPELGMAYLGTQGDVWDAQKDMSLAALGALLGLLGTLPFARRPR